MSTPLYTLELRGCAPLPLSQYLKALGVLRLISQQKDSNARGWWENDTFRLQSVLDRDRMLKFFLSEYSPTPLVAPWNGGSGFYPKDNKSALAAISASKAQRFEPYRILLTNCRELIGRMSLVEKPVDDEKPALLQNCRNTFPDESLAWLDAAYLLTSDGPKYPPLLGTGGNDGRLEFTNNYMQRLCEIFDMASSEGLPLYGMQSALEESLFAQPSTERSSAPIGQFDPGSAGGANSGAGFSALPGINLWDFVFMLDGSIAFAAASVKKLEESDPGVLAYPFCVRFAGVGYASAASADEASARAEMWMPLWQQPTSFGALSHLLSEGRVETNRRRAKNGVDFARAIAAVGIDRGVSAFQRYGFQQRNGLSYFAVPLGRFNVRANPGAEELLSPIDGWIDRFRRSATSKTAPASAGRALRLIESAILNLTQFGRKRDVQDLLIALGEAESTVAVSKKLREDRVSPVPPLSSNWLNDADDESPEFGLAASLASIYHERVGPFRRHLEPIDPASWTSDYPRWAETANDPNIVWGSGSLVRNLNAVLMRRMVEGVRLGKEEGETEQTAPFNGICKATLADVSAFLEGHIDDLKFERLLRGLILIDWRLPNKGRNRTVDLIHVDFTHRRPSRQQPNMEATYSLLKLCYLPDIVDQQAIKLSPQILQRAFSGDGAAATRLAARRLRASGFEPAVTVVSCTLERVQRIAASILFPISKDDTLRLKRNVIRRDKKCGIEEDDREAHYVTP